MPAGGRAATGRSRRSSRPAGSPATGCAPGASDRAAACRPGPCSETYLPCADAPDARSRARRRSGVRLRRRTRRGRSRSAKATGAPMSHDQPPIEYIGRGGATNFADVDLVAFPLAGDVAADQRGDLLVGRAGAHQRLHVVLFDGEQAVAQLAVGGQADAVAVQAERPAHRGDEAHRAAAVGEVVLRGGRARIGIRAPGSSGAISRDSISIISSASSTLPRSHRFCASSGMNSMYRTSKPFSRAKRASGTMSGSTRFFTATALSLIGDTRALRTPRCPPARCRRSSRRVISLEALAVERVEVDVDAPQPGVVQRRAPVPAAGRRWWSAPDRRMPGIAASRSISTGRSRRTSGSPPVTRSLSTPEPGGDAHEPLDLLEVQNLARG